LIEETSNKLLDFWIDQRFPTADGDHGSIAFLSRTQAILQRHHVLEAGRVLADAPAPGAGQVAGMERLKLKDEGKTGRFAQLMPDYVTGNFNRQCERKSHSNILNQWLFETDELKLSDHGALLNCGQRTVRVHWLGGSLKQTGQEKRRGGNALGSTQSAAAGQKKKDRQHNQPQKYPI
jgi:hypothetical protein